MSTRLLDPDFNTQLAVGSGEAQGCKVLPTPPLATRRSVRLPARG